MPHLRIDLAYNGLQYFGFQSQPHGNTIQDLLEAVLFKYFGREVKVTGASRTDTGVSAEHQVVSFFYDESVDLTALVSFLNQKLPTSIRVIRASIPQSGFHPAYSAVGKIYRYRIWKGECHNPFVRDFVWENFRGQELLNLERIMSDFIGRHDFRSFANMGFEYKSTVRRIYDIKVEETSSHIDIWVMGSGFLKQMVRIMVGTVVDKALGRLDESILEIMELRDRKKSGRVAPANGLCLVRILYDDIPSLAEFIQQYSQQATVITKS
jgi:tRNA pseudouridine38-40 synthase